MKSCSFSLECLDDVFDRLDDDGNGYLSFEEFTDGFTRCLQTGFEPSDTTDDSSNPAESLGYGAEKGSYDDSSNDEDFINRIISAVDMKDMYYVESVRTQWMLLRGKDPDLIAFMDDIFKKVSVKCKYFNFYNHGIYPKKHNRFVIR